MACALAVFLLAVPAAAATAPPPTVPPTLPLTAPAPTDSGVSPMAPDPSPPVGGVGPLGERVGGPLLTGRGLVLPPHAPALPADLTAQAWVLVDLDSGAVLAARDPHGRYQPASILKTLTCVSLLPLLPGDEVVTVGNAAATTEGSHAGLVAGGRYTVDELFAALLLVSGNDAAEALAAAAGGRAQTVALMNRTAMQLGAYDTFVQTPSGLDGWQQLTSAYDMAIFLRAALAQPRFARYDRTLTATLPWQQVNGYGPVQLNNQNTQLFQTDPEALVAKTGYTDAALHTYVGAFQRNGRRLGVVFLRAQRYPDDQWIQAMNLADWGFRLPVATPAVGQLDAPVALPATSSSPAAAQPSATAETGAAAMPTSRHRSYVVQLALLCALALVAAFAVSQRKLIVAAFRG